LERDIKKTLAQLNEISTDFKRNAANPNGLHGRLNMIVKDHTARMESYDPWSFVGSFSNMVLMMQVLIILWMAYKRYNAFSKGNLQVIISPEGSPTHYMAPRDVMSPRHGAMDGVAQRNISPRNAYGTSFDI